MTGIRVCVPEPKDIVAPNHPLKYTPPPPRATNSFEVDIEVPRPTFPWRLRLPSPIFRLVLRFEIWWEGLTKKG